MMAALHATRSMPSRIPRGCSAMLGKPSGAVVVADDPDIAAAINERDGYAVAVAPAGGLMAAARGLRARYPCLSLLVARHAGQAPGAAQEAAEAVGGLVIDADAAMVALHAGEAG